MIMTRLHLFLIAAFTATLASSAYAESPGQPEVPDKENFKIFLLAGQSNMAGRGADIVLGGNPELLAKREAEAAENAEDAYARALEKYSAICTAEKQQVLEVGGLYILGTERHESRRIDNQLRGRAGRQGDPGESRFYMSLEDDLLRIFGSHRVSFVMDKLNVPEGEAIEHGMISKAIEGAQKKVEAHNFEIRKHLIDYDDVMNRQREVIYGFRNEVIRAEELRGRLEEIVDHVGTKPGVYVLLASWVSPTFSDLGWPTAATIAEWEILAETFADDGHVLFGLCNEPQHNFDGALDGDVWTPVAELASSMDSNAYWALAPDGHLPLRQLERSALAPTLATLRPAAEGSWLVFHRRPDWAMAFYSPPQADLAAIEAAREVLAQLEGLQAVLQQDYSIQIVNRPDIQGRPCSMDRPCSMGRPVEPRLEKDSGGPR